MNDENLDISKIVDLDYDSAVQKTIDALKKEGFGVLTEIDVKKTMKEKLDVDFERYIILGACNPPLAHQALTFDRIIGTLLPCNVIVQELDSNKSKISAINPVKMFEVLNQKDVEPIAKEVKGKLEKVLESI